MSQAENAFAAKIRPVLFSGPMVQAILEGRKTQTRRIAWEFDMHRRMRKIDPSMPVQWASEVHPARESGFVAWYPGASKGLAEFTKKQYATGFECKYGKPGDRLWVRETWGSADKFYQSHENDVPSVVAYRADHSAVQYDAASPRQIPDWDIGQWNWDKMQWKPSIFMPQWASRITLEITSVRVERLQEISEEDARAEGVSPSIVGQDLDHLKYRAAFQSLWDQINGKKAPWKKNPWVWVIDFKRV